MHKKQGASPQVKGGVSEVGVKRGVSRETRENKENSRKQYVGIKLCPVCICVCMCTCRKYFQHSHEEIGPAHQLPPSPDNRGEGGNKLAVASSTESHTQSPLAPRPRWNMSRNPCKEAATWTL